MVYICTYLIDWFWRKLQIKFWQFFPDSFIGLTLHQLASVTSAQKNLQ